MTQQQRIDMINLHIYLGRRIGADVSRLVKLRQQRYLQNWDIYESI